MGSMQPIQISGIDPQAEAQVSIVGERLVGGSLDALKPGEYGVIIGLDDRAAIRAEAGRQADVDRP